MMTTAKKTLYGVRHLILTASKSSAVLCAFERVFFYKSLSNCPAYAYMFCPFLRKHIHESPVEVHTLLVEWVADWFTEQRGFFSSHEGLRLSWFGDYGSCMEWNGSGLIIEQRGFFPSREGLRLS